MIKVWINTNPVCSRVTWKYISSQVCSKISLGESRMKITDCNALSCRRRDPRSVTRTACTECRKGKAKVTSNNTLLAISANQDQQCNGQRLCACCISKKRLNCEYRGSVYIKKEALKQEIRELRECHQLSEQVLGSFAYGDRLEFIILSLQRRLQLEEICEQLDQSNLRAGHLICRPLLQRGNEVEVRKWGIANRETLGTSKIDEFKRGSRWTELSLDNEFIEHLLLLYFCWEYPIFSSLSKRHFVDDFNAGQDRYCLPLLVNAILAVACELSDQDETPLSPNNGTNTGIHFYAEAERLLLLHHGERSITIVQALAQMSLWNTSRRRDRKAQFYAGQAIRMTVEMGLHCEMDTDEASSDELEVRRVTFWGAFILDR